MSETDRGGPHRPGRRIAGHAQDDHRIDPYQVSAKPKEGTVCPECGAAFHAGRWQWGVGLTDIDHALCPACRRIRDHQPAGIVELVGGFVSHHKDEILNLVRNLEERERAEHPMNRVMGIEEQVLGLEIRTTDIHLPRRIGEAIRRAYEGRLDVTYDEEGYFVRVRWERAD